MGLSGRSGEKWDQEKVGERGEERGVHELS